jgi:hypothetical protein
MQIDIGVKGYYSGQGHSRRFFKKKLKLRIPLQTLSSEASV